IVLVFFAACALAAVAQERPSTAIDPRVGLKAGLRDAGVAARNLELVKSIPKPEGFFDPKSPLGTPMPAEQTRAAAPPQPSAPPVQAPTAQQPPAQQPPAQPPSGIDFANSDIAFSRDYLFMGNFS